MRTILLAIVIGACGGPALQNAPHPNNAIMAGGFAAAAAAVTLASPTDAAKKAESSKTPPSNDPVPVKENVPADVFDRLDHQGSGGSGAGSAAAKGPAGRADETRGAPLIVPPEH